MDMAVAGKFKHIACSKESYLIKVTPASTPNRRRHTTFPLSIRAKQLRKNYLPNPLPALCCEKSHFMTHLAGRPGRQPKNHVVTKSWLYARMENLQHLQP